MDFTEVQKALETAIDAVSAAKAVPEVIYDEARSTYIVKTLTQVRDALDTLAAVRRDLVEQAVSDGTLTRRQVADASGLDLSTVQRWSKHS